MQQKPQPAEEPAQSSADPWRGSTLPRCRASEHRPICTPEPTASLPLTRDHVSGRYFEHSEAIPLDRSSAADHRPTRSLAAVLDASAQVLDEEESASSITRELADNG